MEESSNKIYESIQVQVQNVIHRLSELKPQNGLAEEIKDARENLNFLNNQLQTELEMLKANSEWNRFTIAFYGETGAGKSTLIEAIRLYLGEKSKQESQKKFKEIQQQLGLTQEAFDDVQSKIMEAEKAFDKINYELSTVTEKYAEPIMYAELEVKKIIEKSSQEFDELTMEHTIEIRNLESEILKLSDILKKIKAEQNWFEKIYSLLCTLPEKKQLSKKKQYILKVKKKHSIELKELSTKNESLKSVADKDLSEIKSKKVQEQLEINNKKELLQKELRKHKIEEESLENKAKKLEKFADGQIIGDGLPDYTRENTIYDFDLSGQLFSLIDVPGIEGNESIVTKPIEEAVRKAHAVFYVTRAARPPQTNDGNTSKTKGTLEKIKSHLGAQSEVWSIYNHPVKNPRQLSSPLLNEDNRNSLIAMDEKLKSELKEQYCESIAISAQPAYLALTECIIPGSGEAIEKRKFLAKFNDSDTILALSGLTKFVKFLREEIICDYKNKIKHSNLNKAYKAIRKSLLTLEKLQEGFSDLEININREFSSTQAQIKISMEEFSGGLNSAGNKIRRNFQKHVQECVYDEIENDISNDEFKQILKNTLNEKSKKIEKKLKKSIEKEADAFEDKMKKIIQRSNQHLKNIVEEQNNNISLGNNFKLDIKLDNGLKLGGLVASGISAALGAAFLITNPVGWTVAFVGGVLALVGSIVGIAKSIWGFFDSDYKKSQQKKETDKILRVAKENIDKEIRKINLQIEKEMSSEMKKIIEQLKEPARQCSDVNKFLAQANKELNSIANEIRY
ncbi:MAG: hypothetical protein ACK5NC_13910 [Vibrio sp.]